MIIYQTLDWQGCVINILVQWAQWKNGNKKPFTIIIFFSPKTKILRSHLLVPKKLYSASTEIFCFGHV